MATLDGDTLSLAALGSATGKTGPNERSLKVISGESGSGDNVSLSSFAIDSVNGISGYTYVAESTSEVYTLTFGGEEPRFGKIKSRPQNFTWGKSSNISVETSPDYTANYSFGAKNPQAPGAQTTLEAQESATISVSFSDGGFNAHAMGYGDVKTKTIYVVDAYDGNTVDLCLTLDTPIQLADGTYIQAGDLEEGMELRGSGFDGLESYEDTDYLKWTADTLFPQEEKVKVLGLVYGFAEKLYIFNGGLVKSTMEHPFLVKEEDGIYKFKRAHLIKTSDSFVQLVDGEFIETPIENIEIVEEPTEIVSIDVDGSNIYFANNIVSHNKDQGNTHSDFGNPTAPTGLNWDTATQTLTWSGAEADSDSVNGITDYEVEFNNSSSFTGQFKNSWQAYSDTTITPWIGVFVNSAIPGDYTVNRYVRVRARGNGGKYSGWTTLRTTDDVANPNGFVTISGTIG